MGSSNGTFVNNNRITQQPLSPGDLVQIGSTKFRYEG
jgi:pSer/pThr/pTyr-binding forkhead associated (FHA) protein